MKTFICLILCLLVFAGCNVNPFKKGTTEKQSEAERLNSEYAKYKNGEMKLEKFSEVK